MEAKEQQEPKIQALARKMQAVCYDLGQRVIGEHLDIRTLAVGDGVGFRLTLEDNRPITKIRKADEALQCRMTNLQRAQRELAVFDEFAKVAEDYALRAAAVGYNGSEFSVTTYSGYRITVKKV